MLTNEYKACEKDTWQKTIRKTDPIGEKPLSPSETSKKSPETQL